MTSLKEELTSLALDSGAIRARVTIQERLDGPPSADPTSVLPGARSVVSYAVYPGRDFIPDYFGKVTRMAFKRVMFDSFQLVGAIGQELVGYLEARGFRAFSPSPNGVYRRESTLSHLLPDFSHRYAALASGLGALGWSGNVLVPGCWSAVYLGSVLTDAKLEPDEPLDEELCDKCKLCTQVCPNRFFSASESQTVTLGGREYTCSRKGNHIRCAISCGSLAGLSHDRKWSTWALGTARLPEGDDTLPEIWVRELANPDNEYIIGHLRPKNPELWRGPGVLARSLEDTNPTCNTCMLLCSGPKEWRQKLVKLLHSSGRIVLQDGEEVAVDAAPESESLLQELKEQLVTS